MYNKKRHKNNSIDIEYRSEKVKNLVIEQVYKPILDKFKSFDINIELQHCLVITFSELNKEIKKEIKDKLKDMLITYRFYKNRLFIENL